MDYTSGPYPVTFPAGVTSVTFDVPITDDSILEGNENFILTIDQSSLPTGVIRGDPDETTVTIVDDDSKQFLQYMCTYQKINVLNFVHHKTQLDNKYY